MKGLKSRKKTVSNDEMMLKKRRNLRGFGYKRDLLGDWGNDNWREGRGEEMYCNKSERVSQKNRKIGEELWWNVCWVLSLLFCMKSPSRCGQPSLESLLPQLSRQKRWTEI